MKIVDRYIVSSILRTALATLFICTLLVLAVELFSSMNNYVTNSVAVSDIIWLSVLGLPEYLMMCVSISFLFATTFFLSQLEGNNEMIMLLNAGLSYRRICLPIAILAIVVTLVFFIFSQTVMIDATVEHDRLSVEYFGQTSTQDASNVSAAEFDGSVMINAGYYSDSDRRLYDVTMITRNDDGSLSGRVEALNADWLDGHWVFSDGRIYEVENGRIVPSFFDEYESSASLEPYLFTDQSRNISTMDWSAALSYLERVREVDSENWHRLMTEFLSRVFSTLPILVLVLICLLMNYRYKKNIFLFSLIQSLCTAVVYYVVQMLVTIMCEQAMMAPAFSVIIPVVTVIVLSLIIRTLGRIHG